MVILYFNVANNKRELSKSYLTRSTYHIVL